MHKLREKNSKKCVNNVTVDQMNRTLDGQYTWSIKKGSNLQRSVVIGVRKEIPHRIVDLDTDLPIVGIQIQNPISISIACAYLPCGRLLSLDNQVRRILDQLPEPKMFIGDLNGHHPAWGCQRADPRGVTLCDIFVQEASRSLAGKVLWLINPDLCGSDHYPVQVRLSTASPPENTRTPRWRYGKLIGRHQYTNNWLCPRAEGTPLVERRNQKGQAKSTPEAQTHLPKRSSKCRQEIRTAKQNCWSNFLESINAEQSSAELWSRINALSGKRRSSPLQIRTDAVTITDPTVVADELGKYFAKLSGISEYSESFRQRVRPSLSSVSTFGIPPDNDDLPINSPLSWEDLGFAFSRSNGNSAGPGEISYPLLKHLSPEGNTKLLDLYNQLWTAEEYPENWRESLVIPLPKTNVGTKDITGFRPIALTCCMAKVLERMVNRRLKQYLEAKGLLDHRQHAFRQGYGTSTYFATLGEVLKEAKDQGHHAEIVSLDI
ncbi:uncharacterized protein LOC135702933 [Ochlerotatus camptorhynchus]|uniref:uncharacterized protein LOC135702933 n=1 Tax=Ochlerotatus camptorhynchus TaxID=644619 RepID=UPI0031E199D3